MMACLGNCFGMSSENSASISKSHPGAQRLNERLRANLNMPLPPLPEATRNNVADKPLPPLPQQEGTDIELQPNQQQRPLGRVTSTRSNNNQSNITGGRPAPIALPWETSRLAKHELADMYNEVHRTMGHIPYVVSGVGALIDHGFTGRTANRVTIIVPEESKGVVRSWAAASGSHDGAGSDSVGVRMPQDGSLRRVRVRWIGGAAFAGLDIVASSLSAARVLGLASQIDQISTAWLQYRERLAAPGLTTQRDRARLEREMATMVGDIFWCLRRAAATRTPLRPDHLRLFLSEKVWAPFTAAHADARVEMQRAGVDVAAVLAAHRERGEVRAHDALLRQYGLDEGMGGGVVTEPPGAFEGMRGLGRENVKDNGLLSVYTVSTSVSDLASSSNLPPPPPPPMPTELSSSKSRRVRELPAPASSLRMGMGGRADPAGREELARQRNRSPAPARMSLEERGAEGGGRRGELGRSLTTTTTRKVEKEVQPERQNRHQARHSVDMVSGRGTPEHWL